MVSVSNELYHYFDNNHGYRHAPRKGIGNRFKMNIASSVQHCLHGANGVEKVPIFIFASAKCIWVEKYP